MGLSFDIRSLPRVKGDNLEAREARQRAAEAKTLFGGEARKSSPGIDLNKATGPAKTSGVGMSVMDIYQGVTRSDDEVKRAERQERLDKLPVPVQRLAQTQGVTDLATLEIVGAVHRKSEIQGGEKVQIHASDLAKAAGTTTQRAGEILEEAVRRRWLVPGASYSAAGGFFRTNLD
jgi:hypothetical protein